MKFTWYCHQNIYTPIECNNIRELVNKCAMPGIMDIPAGGVTKTAKVQHALYNDVKHLLERFVDCVNDTNTNCFGFDLHPVTGFDAVHMNTYEANCEYGWHPDGTLNEMHDSKLTAILNLTEGEVEGGDFELFVSGSERIPNINQQGSILVFPSFINHRVLPVTKGTRVTLAHWFLGPNWR